MTKKQQTKRIQNSFVLICLQSDIEKTNKQQFSYNIPHLSPYFAPTLKITIPYTPKLGK